jgi:tetratricopeptide (TPR) repeat protein
MIEATCPACGTLNRVSEATVPAGAKFVTCADCKSRVAIPPPATMSALPPPIPKAAIPVPPPARTTDVIDLADLPAPKRASALGPLPAPVAPPRSPQAAKPGSRSGLAAALDPELPAPKMTRSGSIPPAPLELDELLLSSIGDSALDDVTDLLAPKHATPRSPADAPFDSVIDLPAPKLNRDVADLPAPKRSAKPPLPQLSPAREPLKDLSQDALIQGAPTIADLAAPMKGPTIADLPAPRTMELAPKADASTDLPAPKGFFDDLPQPALDRDRPDLPAPKGFFDDLPQPALDRDRSDLPAPKGYFDDLPQVKHHPSRASGSAPAASASGGESDVPAPKGFFDDIPGLPHTGKPEVPAPKGYFDNIPALPHTSKPEVPAPKGYFDNIPALPHTSKPEVPAPKGFFDDIPGRASKKTDDVAPKGFFDDLPQRARPPSMPPGRGEAASEPVDGDLVLEGGPELDLMSPAAGDGASFDDLDLSRPSVGPAAARPDTAQVRFDPVARPAGRPARASMSAPDALSLELEGGRPGGDAVAPPKRPAKAKPVLDVAALARAKTRRKQLAIGGVLAVIMFAGGGFVLYRRHDAAVRREAALHEQLTIARASYVASDPQHWQRAAAAARQVIELDSKNAEALGIAAESLLASAIGDGTAAAAKIGQARGLLDSASAAGLSGPQLARARALSALAAHQPDAAIAQLQPLAAKAPSDGALALYLGWAFAARGDSAEALKVYDRATADPAIKIAALYGRGTAKLELADLDGARADFSAVLEQSKDHIGAQVGLAAAQPPAAAQQQQEEDLLAILARKDIAQADPRAVAQAWTLAGTAAMRAGRSDVARERFRKALAVIPQDVAATTRLAETELRDGKVTTAAELIATALTVAKDNVAAQLVQSEIEIKQNKLPIASDRLAALANHATPLAPLDRARLYLVTGRLLEAQGKDDEAVDAYTQGAKAAGDLDLAPMMAAVGKLAQMTTAAAQARNTARADELRARADELLGELAAHAQREPHLAMTLGVAYLQQGNAAKAEPWLRRVIEARPNDAEARFQLGRARLQTGHPEDALESLNAALGLDPARADIGLELARTYEALGRDSDAGALYAKLLVGKEPSLELRARAGRFFARTGAIDKAGEQGAKIVETDPHSAAGLYLKGEGMLSAGKALEARQLFQRALEVDRDPQYLDALGRAAEALSQGGDRELQDLALRSYQAAAEAAPTMFNPLAGQGRLYVARHEAAKAVRPLLEAGRIDPRNADVLFLLGAAYQELQQTGEALRALEASARLAPRAEGFWRLSQIYRDANQGAPAAAAVGNATRLAVEAEKHSGKSVPWLTEALYLQGRVNFDLHNDAVAREAWMLYVARNPPGSAQLTEVKRLLGTSLRR